jgi:hypothetical protein
VKVELPDLGRRLSVHRRGGKLSGPIAAVSSVLTVATTAVGDGGLAVIAGVIAIGFGFVAIHDGRIRLEIFERGVVWSPAGTPFALAWADIATVEAKPSPLDVQWLAVTTRFGTDHVIPAGMDAFRVLQASLEGREPRLAAMLLPAARVVK